MVKDLVRRFRLFLRLVAIVTISILVMGCSPSSKHLGLDPFSNFEQVPTDINDVLRLLQSRPLDQLWRISESQGYTFGGARIIVVTGFDSAQMVELFFDEQKDLTETLIGVSTFFGGVVVSPYHSELSEQEYTQFTDQALSMGLKKLSSKGTEQENAELSQICAHATVYAIEAVIEDELFAVVRSDCDVDFGPVRALASRLLHAVMAIKPAVSEHTQFMQRRLASESMLHAE